MIPRVYGAINAVTAAFARHGVAKDRFNLADDYAYRSIDDVVVRLSPLLAEHKLCVLPRVLERAVTERQGLAGELLVSVALKVAYDLVSLEDGSRHTVKVYGEALDPSDKATAKALQSAYKYAMIQAFAIPVSGSEDADARSPRLGRPEANPEASPVPVQGWEPWSEDILDTIRRCESREALDRLQGTHRKTLAALQRERCALYNDLGKAIAARRAELAPAGEGWPVGATLADGGKASSAQAPHVATVSRERPTGGSAAVPRARSRRRKAAEALADA